MAQILRRLQSSPRWLTTLLKEIDTLDFGPGFNHFRSDARMTFGTTEIRGVQSIKQFFTKIGTPLVTNHRVHEFWDGGDLKLVRGDAVIAKRTDLSRIIVPPMAYFFTMSTDDLMKISKLSILIGPINP